MDPHNCLSCQIMIINDSDFCSNKCEEEYMERQERSRQILECLRRICDNASTEGCEDSAVVDLKLINEGRKLLQWPELKPNGQ